MEHPLHLTEAGFHCPAGPFHIDPWRPVPVAVVTHAHSDHARPGSGLYYCAAEGLRVMRRRLGQDARIEPVPYGAPFRIGAATVSFHPAGHVFGSAQVRVETAGSVWVVSGDYKRDPDPTCPPFEVVPCDGFVTEATFALPIYRWRPPTEVVAEVASWWRQNAAEGRVSALFCYALGKAQRLLAELARLPDLPQPGAVVHGSVEPLVEDYRASGIAMLPTRRVTEDEEGKARRRKPGEFAGALVVAPPSAAGSTWMRRFGPPSTVDTAFASGWMQVRGIRRRRGYDRGFVLSDHADWPGLVETVRETGAREVWATHGSTEVLARHLREGGVEARGVRTGYAAEEDDA